MSSVKASPVFPHNLPATNPAMLEALMDSHDDASLADLMTNRVAGRWGQPKVCKKN